MDNKALLVLNAIVFITSCAIAVRSTNIPTHLQVKEFNSLYHRHLSRPTTVSLAKMSDGAVLLRVFFRSYTGELKVVNYLQAHTDKYIKAIDTYFKWKAIALEGEDAFEKIISEVPGWASGTKSHIQFRFYSGSETSHFLLIYQCGFAGCLTGETGQYYNASGAKELKRLLLDFKNNKLKHLDIDSKYKT